MNDIFYNPLILLPLNNVNAINKLNKNKNKMKFTLIIFAYIASIYAVSGQDVLILDENSPSTANAKVGQAIQVSLPADKYEDPKSSDEKVVAPDGNIKGNFKAASAGTADITAECTAPVIDCNPWKVTVTVGDGTSTPPPPSE